MKIRNWLVILHRYDFRLNPCGNVPSQTVRNEASRGAANVYLTAWALGSDADAGANGQTGTVQIPV